MVTCVRQTPDSYTEAASACANLVSYSSVLTLQDTSLPHIYTVPAFLGPAPQPACIAGSGVSLSVCSFLYNDAHFRSQTLLYRRHSPRWSLRPAMDSASLP